MPHDAPQVEGDTQFVSWLHELDEQQAILNHWKIEADKLEGLKRKELLSHIDSVESKIEQVREHLYGSRSSRPENPSNPTIDHANPTTGHAANNTDEAGPKDTLKVGVSRALGDLSKALRKASERLSHR